MLMCYAEMEQWRSMAVRHCGFVVYTVVCFSLPLTPEENLPCVMIYKESTAHANKLCSRSSKSTEDINGS